MKKVKREEVASILVKDKYFSKGNYWLKIWQTLVALLGWMIVVLPFIWVIWVFFPLTRPERAKDFFLYAFLSEKKMLYFLIGFFVLIFFSFLITLFVLTRWNNRNLHKKVNESFEYEDEELEKRQELLEEMYTERFGTKEERETVRFYSVSAEQNLDTTFIADLYKENGVELK
ncbi:TPA: hypothetical protein QFD63_002525 [Enterococcus faecium]|uniref:hypothetical protein n=2 Tax=Enterococcus faecium TaxID=1352 RepID=UPI001781B326|nr:hypothetical protein [Enterococcus faecium]MBD9697870.1 hypothetical protein [Enterococcus faecium]MBE9862507.1 hypothetical protein [Enterococcus faecium]MCI1181322.1 alkaline shock response membrane anchor protein AmaP [Enterococcus faecium]MCT9087209.1 alkaline shock response membrane anchor protein AmaP [Enterococcus faecium]MDQ8516413.1 hypothetical protein [Enterococcus faecium]